MDSDGEEPPSKRCRYERSSTPIREIAPSVEGGWGRFGDADCPAPGPVAEPSDTEQEDTFCVDDPGPDYFGLSNEDMESFVYEVEAEEKGVNWSWEELPNELWQLVFQQVPLLDLVTSGRRVCQRWNQIISDEKFLHWKKLYFQLKHCDPATVSTVTTILRPLLISTVQQQQPSGQYFTQAGNLIAITPNYTLVHLARLFADTFSQHSIDLGGMLSMMSRHPQYSCVSQIKDQLAFNGPDLGVLVRLLLLVACCMSVHQVLLLIKLLCSPMSGGFSSPALAYGEMSEMFHAMATFFLFLWNQGSLPPRFHYNVFYSLDVLHRSSFVPPLCYQPVMDSPFVSLFNYSNVSVPTSSPSSSFDVSFSNSQGSQSSEAAAACSSQRDTLCEYDDVPLTSEQARVVVHPIKMGETLKVIAFAGTGKTTTLVQFAKRNSHLRMGYCVYNKSVQENAADVVFKNCKNVKCLTFHSIAYKHVGHAYTSKAESTGSKKFVDLKAYYVSNYISNAPKLAGLNNKQSLYSFAKYVKGTLENYWASTDRVITSDHIPRFNHSDAVRVITMTLNSLAEHEDTEHEHNELSDENYVWRVIEESRKIWEKMKNLRDKSILMTHDGYLKLFQLSGENFAKCKHRHWDVVLIDETQDLSPAIIDLVKKATNCAKIFVGDPNQQIYSFRGAVNAMPLVEADLTFYLTRSFRFGPEIAYVNALLLGTLKGVRRKTFVGTSCEGCVFGTRDFNQVTIIARTNIGLFEEMAKVLRSPGGERKRLGFIGKLEFGQLELIHLLFQGNFAEARKRNHPYGQQFKSFHELQQYAEHSNDIQLQREIRVCQRYPTDLQKIIKQLRRQEVKDHHFADVIFTTAHKSKGLEFDNVKLADDFLPNFDLQQSLDTLRLSADERNLLYVAASRAKKQIILSPTCINVLQKSREHFVYPAVVQDAVTEAAGNCAVCHFPFSDSCQQPRLKLFRPAVKLSTGMSAVSQREGFVCRHCGYGTLSSFSFAF